ncbi:hypothetical protein PPROV_000894400 [Pycnococcus provasolii]|uniref:Uncharacterized protein n=1 Tax=Pycnococcus provasolii TaxID=41880 RepID=A0A830HSX0_9CHLO|nr:hypothetical protein PPROV_000894400 [Pycnococcus provasolii]|mmetsp:Transcript_5207/g.11639  ORF Transcript_5207/g.11639 Transcript_5207/m.11639 type:complete len:235 (-) Transcript_5207:72-776(-)|eukprot:CAMPEP_0206123326 /NCGR_PEP_ID=MMETSP1472-20131121/2762_1 /ASSEMBLY_ACC=CAM_ASM_001108 /TAXON_ID=41880 /ORGANISM="Pycnococcus provasolii, Strain RCC251" /LENGTH=234 /DNA_ID=CAMNT_0053513897 /DNA_START=18 /DNA_END=722 /DNA_ORIENTATION=+
MPVVMMSSSKLGVRPVQVGLRARAPAARSSRVFSPLASANSSSSSSQQSCDVQEVGKVGKGFRRNHSGNGNGAALSMAAATVLTSLAMPEAAHAGWDALLTTDYWAAFLQWRVSSPLLFIGTFIVPNGGLFLLFQYILNKKRDNFKAQLREAGWDTFLKERGVDIETLNDVKQLRYFCRLQERNLLDEQKVNEFVEYQRKKMEYYSPVVVNQYNKAKAAEEEKEAEAEKEESAN